MTVELVTAQLARAKNCNVPSQEAYDSQGNKESAIQFTGESHFTIEDVENANENGYFTCLAPSQSDLKKHLREHHNIHVEVMVKFYRDRQCFRVYIRRVANVGSYFSESYMLKSRYNIYEAALEAGLVEGLHKVINQ